MRINSEDCYIEYRKKAYYLFVPKSKKEIKEEEGVLVKGPLTTYKKLARKNSDLCWELNSTVTTDFAENTVIGR